MGLLALPWYGVLLSWAYSLSLSERSARESVEKLVESRRQLLVSPLEYRQKQCHEEADTAQQPGVPASLLNPFNLHCTHETLWRTRNEWQPLCRNFGRDTPLYAPRYYRLCLSCFYRFGEVLIPLPRVSWDLFR